MFVRLLAFPALVLVTAACGAPRSRSTAGAGAVAVASPAPPASSAVAAEVAPPAANVAPPPPEVPAPPVDARDPQLASATTKKPLAGPPGCIPLLNDPRIAQYEEEAQRKTSESYSRALDAEGLLHVPMPSRTVTIDEERYDFFDGTTRRRVAEGTLTTFDGKSFLAGSPHWTGAAGGGKNVEFVSDRAGAVHMVRRAPTARVRRVTVCLCQPPRCGPYGSPCPACYPTQQMFYGPLEHVLGGPATIMYEQTSVELVYVGGLCPNQVCIPRP